MAKLIIKICGIRHPEIAQQAVQAGADWIGIVFHSPSKRYVNDNQAFEIAQATRQAGGTPVAVFVNHTASEMQAICEASNITTVQLHGVIARAYHRFLPEHYQRIYVQTVLDNGELLLDQHVEYLNPDRDFILVDHPLPGQGKSFDWSLFQYPLSFRWFLAGGLNQENVTTGLTMLQPNGIDVSSGVEKTKYMKDIIMIREFIAKARGTSNAA